MENEINKDRYITVNHLDDYVATNNLRVGMKLLLKKDHDNPYDDEAIAVYSGHGNKIGYVANSVSTVCRGTLSAGRIFDEFGEQTECYVKFIAVDSGFAISVMDKIDEEESK